MSQYYPGYQQPMYPPTYQMQMPQMQRTMPMMQQGTIQQQTPMEQSIMTLVTSREQAVVAQIPFDGKTYFFHNTANDEVYSKRFDNATGTAPLVTYGRMDRTQEAYAPLSMVQQMAQQMQTMQEALQGMAAPKSKRATSAKEEESA